MVHVAVSVLQLWDRIRDGDNKDGDEDGDEDEDGRCIGILRQKT